MRGLFDGNVPVLDLAAVLWFLLCWGGYNWFSTYSSRASRGLVGASHDYRVLWAQQLLRRENRVVDSGLVGNLMRSVSFYANTTIYVIAGLMAVWGTLDRTMDVFSELPFARQSAREIWELRLVLLLVVFIFAYFKFSWALREFNLLSLMIGGAPEPRAVELHAAYADKMASVNSIAGEEFNRGVRSYYFGLAALAWFVQPWLFIASTTLVLVVLYRRDYTSSLLRVLRSEP